MAPWPLYMFCRDALLPATVTGDQKDGVKGRYQTGDQDKSLYKIAVKEENIWPDGVYQDEDQTYSAEQKVYPGQKFAQHTHFHAFLVYSLKASCTCVSSESGDIKSHASRPYGALNGLVVKNT